MKFFTLYFLLFFLTNHVLAQSEVPCNCKVLNTAEKKYFANEEQASLLLNKYIDELWAYSKIRKIDDPFIIREAGCRSPTSIICETMLANGRRQNVRLVLYNNLFLNTLTQNDKEITLVDKHVLLHELGHHVLGHHKKTNSLDALNTLYEAETPDPKLWNKYGADNPMAQELEADIYAVWAMSKLESGFTVSRLIAQLNSDAIKKLDDMTKVAKHSDHPLFTDRIEVMKKFETELKRMRSKTVGKNYFSDIAGTAYLALWPESYVYDVSLSTGLTLAGQPDFSVAGVKTDAFLYPLNKLTNYHIGLSISRFRWDKPWQTEMDVQWSQHKYGTTMNTNEGDKLIETLQVKYLTFTPKMTWSSIGASQRSLLRSMRVGFIASVGINARFPVGKTGYTNFIATAAAPKVLFSVGPKVSVGLAIMKKSFLPRGFKVLFSYDPQWIRLDASPKPGAVSHNVACTLQYSIFRK